MKHVITTGSVQRIVEASGFSSKLKKGTYNLKQNPMTGEFYLEEVAPFQIPDKIYGDMTLVERCKAVYKTKSRNFGLLMAGLKGSGKTLTLRKLAIDLDQPVIVINEHPRDGSETAFLEFLSEPALGDCTIVIDEFEKKFSREDPTVLTLLDGPSDTHHFFILTVNELYINENLRNRPGRIYYTAYYSGLSEQIIKEVAEDLLVNKDHLQGLYNACDEISSLSFDMLISIINDMNRFNEPAKEVLKYFGFSHESQYAEIYQMVNGKKVTLESSHYFNPERGHDYSWVEYTVSPDPSVPKESVRVDFNAMQKVARNHYIFRAEINPSNCASHEEDGVDEDGDPIYKVVVPPSVKLNSKGCIDVEIEIHMSATPKLNYIY